VLAVSQSITGLTPHRFSLISLQSDHFITYQSLVFSKTLFAVTIQPDWSTLVVFLTEFILLQSTTQNLSVEDSDLLLQV
jgi:hypothetical protein